MSAGIFCQQMNMKNLIFVFFESSFYALEVSNKMQSSDFQQFNIEMLFKLCTDQRQERVAAANVCFDNFFHTPTAERKKHTVTKNMGKQRKCVEEKLFDHCNDFVAFEIDVR